MKSRTKGFTLIELLVVIAIIGVLASLVLVALNIARDSARDARRIRDVQEIRKAIELYYDDYGTYPATPTGGLVSNMTTPGTNNITPYINTIPTDPENAGNNRYWYRISNQGTTEQRKHSYTMLMGWEGTSTYCKITGVAIPFSGVAPGYLTWETDPAMPACDFN